MTSSGQIVTSLTIVITAFLWVRVVHAEQVVYVIRHAEVDLTLRSEDPPLTVAGRQRARNWGNVFQDAALQVIFANERERTKETALQIAEHSGTPVELLPRWDVEDLTSRVQSRHGDGAILIVSHWLTIPHLLRALGYPREVEIGRDDFDDLFVIVPSRGDEATLLHLRFQ